MTVYICKDELEGIFTAVYDAWASGSGHENVRIEAEKSDTFELFCQYIWVETDMEKAEKVSVSIRKKISAEAYEMIYRTAMSSDPEKADCIYRFLIQGFKYGRQVTSRLSDPAVMSLFEIDRRVGNESEKYIQFTRFKELDNGILFGRIAPTSRVITLIADHFTDRLPSISWIIYDEVRNEAVFHQADEPWFLARPEGEVWEQLIQEKDKEEEYEFLWKNFFKTIGIKERKNYRCQRNFLPLHYRSKMTEFQE